MLKRPLGKFGPEITVIGLGTWAMRDAGRAFSWGPQEDEVSVETIHCSLDAGVNRIDPAPIYGLGNSEEVVVRAMKGPRSLKIDPDLRAAVNVALAGPFETS